MASLSDVLTAAVAVKTHLSAGEPVAAWESTLPLQQFAIDAARAVGFKAAPTDAATKQQINACLCECELLCKTPPTMTKSAVGAIGDGSIMKLILQLVMTLLPLFA